MAVAASCRVARLSGPFGKHWTSFPSGLVTSGLTSPGRKVGTVSCGPGSVEVHFPSPRYAPRVGDQMIWRIGVGLNGVLISSVSVGITVTVATGDSDSVISDVQNSDR